MGSAGIAAAMRSAHIAGHTAAHIAVGTAAGLAHIVDIVALVSIAGTVALEDTVDIAQHTGQLDIGHTDQLAHSLDLANTEDTVHSADIADIDPHKGLDTVEETDRKHTDPEDIDPDRNSYSVDIDSPAILFLRTMEGIYPSIVIKLLIFFFSPISN